MAESKFQEIKFTDVDVVNLDNWIPNGEYNPHKVGPWLIHEAGFVLAVVFASCLQEALDEAVDENKLDKFRIHPERDDDRADYMTDDFAEADGGLDPDCPEYEDTNGHRFWWKDGRAPALLGNASEPFDLDNVSVVALPNPARSFCAQFNEVVK
jgi:hypothetical protein